MKLHFLMNMRRTDEEDDRRRGGGGGTAEEIVEHVAVKGEKCMKRDKRHVMTGSVDAF